MRMVRCLPPFVQARQQLRRVYGLLHSGVEAADQRIPKGPLSIIGDEAVAAARLAQVGDDHFLRQQARANITPQTKSGAVQPVVATTGRQLPQSDNLVVQRRMRISL